MPVINTNTHTKRVTEYRFSGTEILHSLAETGVLPRKKATARAEIVFQVPGGGDWSNLEMEISPVNPVIIRIIEESGVWSSTDWYSCKHEWESYGDRDVPGAGSREEVICVKCNCPGKRYTVNGDVEWPAT